MIDKNIGKIDEVLHAGPVMPVLVIDDVAKARPIAEALVENGVRALEVTFRTACAAEAMQEMAKVPGAIVGAGTVISPEYVKKAKDAGAQFLVSPGITENLVKSALDNDIPLVPGTANASDIMLGMDLGLRRFKFFPATMNGGIPALKGLGSVFANHGVRFIPTGGINEKTYKEWLDLPFVECVGGSWLTSGNASPEEIAKRAKALGAK